MSLIVPIKGTFTLAGYRMMPAFRDILGAIVSFQFIEEIFRAIEEVLEPGAYPLRRPRTAERSTRSPSAARSPQEEVTYRYPGDRQPALRDVSLTVPKDAPVAFAGKTGAGKTTIVDLLLGLLTPTEDTFRVDASRSPGRTSTGGGRTWATCPRNLRGQHQRPPEHRLWDPGGGNRRAGAPPGGGHPSETELDTQGSKREGPAALAGG